MRIYSNTILSWPNTFHVSQYARVYPGQWQNYYLYRIQSVKPFVLTTYSPIEFLQENCQYYCYDKYHRNKHLEQYGNTFKNITSSNWVNIPKNIAADDIIVIYYNNTPEHPIIKLPIMFTSPLAPSPSLALQ